MVVLYPVGIPLVKPASFFCCAWCSLLPFSGLRWPAHVVTAPPFDGAPFHSWQRSDAQPFRLLASQGVFALLWVHRDDLGDPKVRHCLHLLCSAA
jgi:hypothetical protein